MKSLLFLFVVVCPLFAGNIQKHLYQKLHLDMLPKKKQPQFPKKSPRRHSDAELFCKKPKWKVAKKAVAHRLHLI